MFNTLGLLVKTEAGKLGRTFTEEPLINGKMRVHIIDETQKLTNEVLLYDSNDFDLIGLIGNEDNKCQHDTQNGS